MLIKVGTRGSKLALVQTNYVIEQLKKAFPENEYEVVVIKTTGDIDQSRPLDQIGSKGLFVDEIERALVADEIQLAVHSMKDMPSKPAKGCVFAKSWTREDARDVIIFREVDSIEELPKNAKIATGSKRRSYQLLSLRPDLALCPIRGNIDTRLRKLAEGNSDGTILDGIVLAAAGLNRLKISLDHYQILEVDEMIPSPAQGTLAIELNEKNKELLDMVNSLSDEEANSITYLERGFLEKIGGDCHLPIGAYAYKEDDEYVLKALFGSEDGSKLATATVMAKEPSEKMIDEAVEDIRKQLEE